MDRQMLSKAWLLMNLERPVTGPTYSDEYIDRWAAIYLDNPVLRLIGVPFSAFLAFPNVRAWVSSTARTRFAARLMEKAEAAIAEAERAEGHGENGRLVEKIRHHTHPRSWRDFAPLRDA